MQTEYGQPSVRFLAAGRSLRRRASPLGHGPQNCSLTLSLNHSSLLHYPVKTISIPSLLFTVRNPCRVCFQTAGVSCAQQAAGSSSGAGICAHVRGHVPSFLVYAGLYTAHLISAESSLTSIRSMNCAATIFFSSKLSSEKTSLSGMAGLDFSRLRDARISSRSFSRRASAR